MVGKRLSGKRVLMVIAPREFRDEELLEPRALLAEQGAQIDVASTAKGQATGMLGATVTPDLLLSEANAESYDAVIVVGGMGSPEHLWDNKDLHVLLQNIQSNNKVIAAICLSGAALARAGVLVGKNATVWPMPESLAALEHGKARYTKEPVVCDGKIITADGPGAASQFGTAIADALAGKLQAV